MARKGIVMNIKKIVIAAAAVIVVAAAGILVYNAGSKESTNDNVSINNTVQNENTDEKITLKITAMTMLKIHVSP